MATPSEFRCPITLEIMSDPVILSSGHTFERCSIQRWLDSGHRTCPITKLPIPDPVCLIPNHALRSLISNYTRVKSHSLIAASDSKVNSLDSVAISALVNCADDLQENALHVLLNLSLDDDYKVGLVAQGVVGKVVTALRRGAGDSRAVAATVLTSLAVVEVNKATIGAYPNAILGLLSLLLGGNGRERKEAATALYTLASFPDNRVRAVEKGAVPILIQNANMGLERAVEVLGLLAKCKEGRQEMIKFGGLLDVLVNLLKNGSSRGVQYALLTMNLLSSYCERMRVAALRQGVFEICLGLLEHDNGKVRRNANSLIQVLQGQMSSP